MPRLNPTTLLLAYFTRLKLSKKRCIKTEIFLDTASADEIKSVLPWGLISGVTTNQKIFLAEKGVDFKSRILEILSLVDGPLSVELTRTADTDEDLIEEAKEYSSWNPKNIVVKVPMFGDGRGLRIVNRLKKENIKTNMTCMVTSSQVLLAAKAGATYASIFFNRAKDSGIDPLKVIEESKQIIKDSNLPTRIIVGSIRKPEDVNEAVEAGAHIITIPYKILVQMPYHLKTEETIKEFDDAWLEFLKSREETVRLAAENAPLLRMRKEA
jgi:transaldolase